MDKTGFIIGLAFTTKVIVLKGRVINFKTIDKNKKWVTQMDVIGIYGQIIPPFIIFKGQQYIDSLQKTTKEPVSDYSIGIIENSWLNGEMGFKWLKYFK